MPIIEKDKRKEKIKKSRRERGGTCGQATKGAARGEASTSY